MWKPRMNCLKTAANPMASGTGTDGHMLVQKNDSFAHRRCRMPVDRRLAKLLVHAWRRCKSGSTRRYSELCSPDESQSGDLSESGMHQLINWRSEPIHRQGRDHTTTIIWFSSLAARSTVFVLLCVQEASPGSPRPSHRMLVAGLVKIRLQNQMQCPTNYEFMSPVVWFTKERVAGTKRLHH